MKPFTIQYRSLRLILSVILISCCSSLFAQLKPGDISIIVKDQQTGFIIPDATIKIISSVGKPTLQSAGKGKATYAALTGKTIFSVSAKGYKTIETWFTAGAGVNAEIALDPVTENRTETTSLTEKSANNITKFTGYVSDEKEGTPLAEVKVSVGARSVTTNSNGYFSVDIPVAAARAASDHPDTISVRFSKTGFGSQVVKNYYLIPVTYKVKISLSQVSAQRTVQGRAAVCNGI